MSTEQALLAAIWEHPHDDTPRLVYADWLEETGDPASAARAEFIRVQCELARLDEYDPRVPGLRKRKGQLKRLNDQAWKAVFQVPAPMDFVRGFPSPSNVAVHARQLAASDADRLQNRPLWWLGFSVNADNWREVFAWPHLDRLDRLEFKDSLPRGWAAQVAGCPGLRNVEALEFWGVPVRPADLRAILDAWAGRRLTGLGLNSHPVGDAVFKVLARHSAVAGLLKLVLVEAGLTPAGARLLATGGGLTGLRELNICDPIGDDGVAGLLRSPHLHTLRKLYLIEAGITNAGAAALANCPGLAGLRTLWLTGSRVGITGLRALCESPHLGQLKELYLAGNPVAKTAEGKKLEKRFRHVVFGY
jgi:uncharacterized protein (TIGR02996 family)